MWQHSCIHRCHWHALFLLFLVPRWDCASHGDCRSHHDVLVSHQPHRHDALGTLSGLAVPCNQPQLLHMERQPRGKRRVGIMTVCFEEHTYILNHVHNVIKKKIILIKKPVSLTFDFTSCFMILLAGHRLTNTCVYVAQNKKKKNK